QEVDGQELELSATALLQHDLQKDPLGDVGAVGAVVNADVLSLAHRLSELVHRHRAGERVIVEPAIAIPLDEARARDLRAIARSVGGPPAALGAFWRRGGRLRPGASSQRAPRRRTLTHDAVAHQIAAEN